MLSDGGFIRLKELTSAAGMSKHVKVREVYRWVQPTGRLVVT